MDRDPFDHATEGDFTYPSERPPVRGEPFEGSSASANTFPQARASRISYLRSPIRFMLPIAVLSILFVFLASILILPRLLYPPIPASTLSGLDTRERLELQNQRLQLQNDARTVLLQALGGMLLLTGVGIGLSQVQADRRLSRERQLTEQFTSAIELLAHEALDARLGGIFALERIARDSPRDRLTVSEVLSAYVRGRSPLTTEDSARPHTEPLLESETDIRQLPPLRSRLPDVQTALTVLGRLPSAGVLDLSNLDLRRVDLRGANLEGAIFTGSNLSAANLVNANLDGALLRGVDLTEANLSGARLHAVDLTGANLSWALLRFADLTSADLKKALLVGADLGSASLRGARLLYADLRQANLQGASLVRTGFQGAELLGANLRGAYISETDFLQSRVDAMTTLPEGFDPSAAGVISIDG
jgi:uncharacterized protein YjbI with pentapeptide repeats